ncbi:unnamed protein product [Schistosoma spindalis]|nr:unnamed protein product [Schistosoma spindale]
MVIIIQSLLTYYYSPCLFLLNNFSLFSSQLAVAVVVVIAELTCFQSSSSSSFCIFVFLFIKIFLRFFILFNKSFAFSYIDSIVS